MRRAVTAWQVVVLLLLLSAVISGYLLLAAAWRQTQAEQAGIEPTSSISRNAVELLSPRQPVIHRVGDPIPITALATRPDYARMELLIDGVAVAASANPDLETAPWQVEFSWIGQVEGVYLVGAQARHAEGRWAVTEAVTVTVVPTGNLFFASNRGGAYAVYRMGSDGRDLVRLSAGPSDARQPCVQTDGTLVYASDSGDGRSVVYLALAGGEPAPIVAGIDPACSPAGGRLAYVAGVEGTSQVLTVYPWGGGSLVVTAETAYAGQPAWSPDGTRIAYVAERDGNSDIWVVPAVGGDPRRVTDHPAVDWAPAWSPDGSRLAFVSNREGSHQVYTMRADGSRVERVTDLAGGAESPAWSPDGFWLALVGYGGFGAGVNARELYLVRADGEHLLRLTHNRSDDSDVVWVP
ncbi:MAG TPA: hypothetical protein VLC95_10560 [Anaerolineae bacterium]|nr:hypothetical protein [Anaerolineae bacterium]